MFAEETYGASGKVGWPNTMAAAGLDKDYANAGHKSKNYGDAEFMDEPLRLIDLIPRRLTTFGLLLLAGLAMVAGLVALYAWMPDLAPLTSDGRVAALDLDGEGGLAAWFSSTVLVLAAMVAVLVYTIRRHKTDDYQGHYRICLWAAMCWLLLSIDEGSSLHEGFKQMMVELTGTSLHGDGSLWWAIPYFFLLGAVGSRLLIDMRSCRLSSLALITTAACYAVAVGAQLLTKGNGGARAVMLEEGAEMVGGLMLLTAMGLHARYVILDAEGLLPQCEPAEDEYEPEEEYEEDEYDEYEEETDDWIKIDKPHRKPRPPRKKKQKARASAVKESLVKESLVKESESTEVKRKLTKGERKALRKRLLDERLERERGQRGKWK